MNEPGFIKKRRDAERYQKQREHEEAKIEKISSLVSSETNKVIAAVDAVGNRAISAEDQRETRERNRDTREKIALAIAGAVVVVAGLQWCTMEKQQQIMKGQLDEMRDEQRAWVSLTKETGIESLSVNDANELRSTIKFGLQNTGKNPAVSVFVNAEMSIGTAIPHGSMAAWQTAVCTQPAGPLGTTMFPGSPEPIFSIDTGLTATELAERKKMHTNTVLAPVIAACIVYNDAVTTKTHHTPVAYEIHMRVPRPGRDCCAIVSSDLPLKGEDLVLQAWVKSNLPPD